MALHAPESAQAKNDRFAPQTPELPLRSASSRSHHRAGFAPIRPDIRTEIVTVSDQGRDALYVPKMFRGSGDAEIEQQPVNRDSRIVVGFQYDRRRLAVDQIPAAPGIPHDHLAQIPPG